MRWELAVEPKHLKNAGLKVTHPRKRILEILETERNKHLTADDIYRSLVEAGEEILILEGRIIPVDGRIRAC